MQRPRLPDFLIIGAAKSGTTSLYAWLDAHPQVFMSRVKETNFFAYAPESGHATMWGDPLRVEFPVRTLDDYAALFASAPAGAILGEASPAYMYSAAAPDRIRRTVPDAKLVAALRNPVDRAYSGYWMAVRHGHEDRPPEDALGPAEPRVRAGFYHASLSRYFDRFDRERIRVILFEDLTHQPLEVFRDLCRFLGVDDDFAPDLARPRNPGGMPRRRWLFSLLSTSRLRRLAEPWVGGGLRRILRAVRDRSLSPAPPLAAEVRSRLIEFYRDDVRALEDLIGRDLSGWLEPAGGPGG